MSDPMQDARIDCIEESCNDLGIDLTLEQMAKIAEDLAFHIEMEYEVESYRHSPGPKKPEFVPAGNIQLYTRVYHSNGRMAAGPYEEKAGMLGNGLYTKETLYIKT